MVLSAFVYASKKIIQIIAIRKLLVRELIGFIPYFFIVFLVRYFMADWFLVKVVTIVLSSFIWFILLHFYFFTESTIKIQFNQLLSRYIKK